MNQPEKENSEDLIAVDVACIGHFEDGSENLYWSVFHAAKSALYPELVEEKQKNDLQKWIELGSTFMNNYSQLVDCMKPNKTQRQVEQNIC